MTGRDFERSSAINIDPGAPGRNKSESSKT